MMIASLIRETGRGGVRVSRSLGGLWKSLQLGVDLLAHSTLATPLHSIGPSLDWIEPSLHSIRSTGNPGDTFSSSLDSLYLGSFDE